MKNQKTWRRFEKVTQGIKAILLRNTQQRQNVFFAAFCNFKFITKQFERRAHS